MPELRSVMGFMIKAVIFDLDGVLTRSDHYHAAAWHQTCKAWSIPFEDRTADLLRGMGRLESAGIVAEKGGVELTREQLAEFAEEKNGRYVQLLNEMTGTDVIAKVPLLLQLLSDRGIPLAVASSSRNAAYILEKTGLKQYFAVVIDGHQISRSKPDPEVFRKTADALGISCKDCLVVEDAVSGVKAALALGAKVAAVGPAANTPGVTYSLKETGDLMEVFREK